MSTLMNGVLFFFGIGRNPLGRLSRSDAEAMQSDWLKIGDDIRKSMILYSTYE